MLYRLSVPVFSLMAAFPLRSQGVGDLMVAPTRVILEGNTRSAEVTVVNRGTAKATFRASFTEMDMLEDGRLQARDKRPGETTASDLVRFAPRQMDIAPGASQTVRIQLKKPAQLPAGEYRSHILFQSLPSSVPPTGNGEEKAFSVALQPVFGVSIPLLVRHQETDVTVTLSDLSLDVLPAEAPLQPTRALSLRLTRQGNRTAYGDMKVQFVPSGGKAQVLGELRGVALYCNLKSRLVKIPLAALPVGAKGSLQVTYSYGEVQKPVVTATLPLL